MASLRDVQAEALVAQIRDLAGWTCWRRDVVTSLNFEGRLAVVNILGETKRANDELSYDCTLRLGVLILCNREDKDAVLDGNNDVRYLDRSVADIERAVHAVTWPEDVKVDLEGHDVEPPEEGNLLSAGVKVSIKYRHNFNDPDTYDPAFA